MLFELMCVYVSENNFMTEFVFVWVYFPLCIQHCSSEGPEGPSGFLERLCFEMKKGYKETMLQLLLSPIHIFVSDNYQVWKWSNNALVSLYGSQDQCPEA